MNANINGGDMNPVH